jgi:MbtH protein
VTNPFEDENGIYHVLINEEGQYSLWPSFVDVPNGWTIQLKSDTRSACLEYISQNWTDMRPQSLIAAMEGLGAVGQTEASQPEIVRESGQRNGLTKNTEKLH